jgi:nucleoside phosphorylase
MEWGKLNPLAQQLRRLESDWQKLDLVQWHRRTDELLMELLGADHPSVKAFAALGGLAASAIPKRPDYVDPARILLSRLMTTLAPPSALDPFDDVDLAIIAAKSVPELTQLLSIGEAQWTERRHPASPSTYHFTQWRSDDGSTLKVIAVSPRSIGMTAAAIEATQLLHLCTPRYLALVGIAAGMDSTWKTGDILFAKTCFDYAAGKIESGENSKIAFTPDGDGIEIAPSLVEWARTVEREPELRLAVQADWVDGTSGGSFPRIHIGPLASGPFVVASDVVKAMIRDQRRNVIVLDMEAFAVAKAAHECARGRTEPFVIKAISDFGDYKKSDESQVKAAFFASRFLHRFTKRYLSRGAVSS